MQLSAIAAVADDLAIGRQGQLLCHIPGDLPRFKSLTMGHTVIMGGNTFRTFPNGPLPHRRNIVITRTPQPAQQISPTTSLVFVSSPQEALSLCKPHEESFIIGGGQIYRHFFPLLNQLYITHIHGTFPDADAFFPSIERDAWRVSFREDHPASAHNPYPFSFTNYIRI